MKCTEPSRYLAVVSLVFALIYYYFAVIDIDFFSTRLPMLGPGPDGQEYFAGAISILRDGVIKIRIGDELLPSRYPPGFPTIIVPFAYYLNGDDVVLAPYLANRLLGLLMLFSIFLFFLYRRRNYAASISVVLLATLPAFVTYSRSSLSDTLGTILILWAFLLTYIALKKSNTPLIALAAVLIGLAVSTRLALLLFSPMMAAVFLIDQNSGLIQHCRRSALIGLCFLLGVSPFLIYNWTNFGSPITTGYDFWLSTQLNTFSIHFQGKHISTLWEELSFQRTRFDVSNSFGTGTYFTPVFFIVTLMAVIHMLTRPTRIKLLLSGSSLLCMLILSFYFVSSLRMYYPHQILAIGLVANFYESIVRTIGATSRKYLLRNVAVACFLIITIGLMVAGYPSRSGHKGGEIRIQLIDLLDKSRLGRRDRRYEPIRRLTSHLVSDEALVIIQTREINVVLASSLLPRRVTVIPEDGEHRFNHSEHWRLENEEIDNYVRRAYQTGMPIYYVGSTNKETGPRDRLELLTPGAHWQAIEHDDLVYLACLDTKNSSCNMN